MRSVVQVVEHPRTTRGFLGTCKDQIVIEMDGARVMMDKNSGFRIFDTQARILKLKAKFPDPLPPVIDQSIRNMLQ